MRLGPAPNSTNRSLSGRARWRVARPDTAAVRSAVSAARVDDGGRASTPAGRTGRTTPWIRGRPRAGLSGSMPTSFTVAPPSRKEGISSSSCSPSCRCCRGGVRPMRPLAIASSSASIAADMGSRARTSSWSRTCMVPASRPSAHDAPQRDAPTARSAQHEADAELVVWLQHEGVLAGPRRAALHLGVVGGCRRLRFSPPGARGSASRRSSRGPGCRRRPSTPRAAMTASAPRCRCRRGAVHLPVGEDRDVALVVPWPSRSWKTTPYSPTSPLSSGRRRSNAALTGAWIARPHRISSRGARVAPPVRAAPPRSWRRTRRRRRRRGGVAALHLELEVQGVDRGDGTLRNRTAAGPSVLQRDVRSTRPEGTSMTTVCAVAPGSGTTNPSRSPRSPARSCRARRRSRTRRCGRTRCRGRRRRRPVG
jgi:hypothetical protein